MVALSLEESRQQQTLDPTQERGVASTEPLHRLSGAEVDNSALVEAAMLRRAGTHEPSRNLDPQAQDLHTHTDAGSHTARQRTSMPQESIQERYQDLFKEAERLGRGQANIDFRESPSKAPDLKTLEQSLANILREQPFENRAELEAVARELRERAIGAYQQQHESRYDSLAWYEKAYHRAANWASKAWTSVAGEREWLKSIGETVGSAAQWVTKTVAEKADQAAAFVDDAFNNPDRALAKLKSAGQGVAGFLGGIAQDFGFDRVGQAIGQAAVGAKDFVVGSTKFVTKSVTGVADVITGKTTLQQLATDLTDHAKQALSGLKDAAVGLARLPLETVRAVGLTAWQVVGGADLVEATKCAMRGEWGMAGMHLAFAAASIGSIALAIPSGGTSLAGLAAVQAGRVALTQGAKTVLKAAAKEGMEALAERAGKEVIERVTTKVGSQIVKETLETAGREAAQRGGQVLLKEIGTVATEQGMRELAQRCYQEASQAAAREALEKLGVKKVVADVTEETLQRAAGSQRALMKELTQFGVNKAAAKEMAREVRQAVVRGKADDALKQVLEDGITPHVTKMVQEGMERSFREGVEKTARQVGEKHALGEAAERAVREGAERGFKEGTETAARMTVREGIEEGFKRFRDRRDGAESSASSSLEQEKKGELTSGAQFEAPVEEYRVVHLDEALQADFFQGRRRREEPLTDRWASLEEQRMERRVSEAERDSAWHKRN